MELKSKGIANTAIGGLSSAYEATKNLSLPDKPPSAPQMLESLKGFATAFADILAEGASAAASMGSDVFTSDEGDSELDPAAVERYVRDLYTVYNPDKLQEVPEIMERYDGRERLLLKRLASKYGPEAAAKRLVEIYSVHRPEKVCEVPEIIERYRGREVGLLLHIITKYRISNAEKMGVKK